MIYLGFLNNSLIAGYAKVSGSKQTTLFFKDYIADLFKKENISLMTSSDNDFNVESEEEMNNFSFNTQKYMRIGIDRLNVRVYLEEENSEDRALIRLYNCIDTTKDEEDDEDFF